MTTQKQRQEGFLSRRSGESGANVVTARRLPIRLSLGAPRETEGLMPMTFARRAADGGLGMTANTNSAESPRAPRLLLLCRALSRQSRAPWATSGQAEGRSKDPPFGKGGAPVKDVRIGSCASLLESRMPGRSPGRCVKSEKKSRFLVVRPEADSSE